MTVMAESVLLASVIPPVSPSEAVALERAELERFILAASGLPDEAWAVRSSRSGLDLHALVAHVAGTYAAQARLSELRRQLHPQLLRLYRMDGDALSDTFVRLHIGDRSSRSAAELLIELRTDGPVAIEHRARLIRPLALLDRVFPSFDGLPVPPLAPFRAVRDLWRHRFDLIETSGHDMDVDADHDGRIIAVIVRGRAAAASRVLGDRSVDLAVGDLGTGMWRFGTPSEPDSTVELEALTLIRLLLAWRSPAATRERSRIDGDVRAAMSLLSALHGAA